MEPELVTEHRAVPHNVWPVRAPLVAVVTFTRRLLSAKNLKKNNTGLPVKARAYVLGGHLPVTKQDQS